MPIANIIQVALGLQINQSPQEEAHDEEDDDAQQLRSEASHPLRHRKQRLEKTGSGVFRSYSASEVMPDDYPMSASSASSVAPRNFSRRDVRKPVNASMDTMSSMEIPEGIKQQSRQGSSRSRPSNPSSELLVDIYGRARVDSKFTTRQALELLMLSSYNS